MMAVASMHPVVEERIKRAAVRRRPCNAQPCPRDAPSMFAPAHACCAYYCPWQLRIALARFLLKHLRKAKKSREARWKVKQMDLWKSRNVAQITTASTRSRGGGFSAEAMRSLVRDELRRGVDDALKRAMPASPRWSWLSRGGGGEGATQRQGVERLGVYDVGLGARPVRACSPI